MWDDRSDPPPTWKSRIADAVCYFLGAFMASTTLVMIVHSIGWQIFGRQPFAWKYPFIICALLSVYFAFYMWRHGDE